MFSKILSVLSVIAVCAAEPPQDYDASALHKLASSGHAVSSQMFHRDDVPLSYKYSAIHEYTTSKPEQHAAHNYDRNVEHKYPVHYQQAYAPVHNAPREYPSKDNFHQETYAHVQHTSPKPVYEEDHSYSHHHSNEDKQVYSKPIAHYSAVTPDHAKTQYGEVPSSAPQVYPTYHAQITTNPHTEDSYLSIAELLAKKHAESRPRPTPAKVYLPEYHAPAAHSAGNSEYNIHNVPESKNPTPSPFHGHHQQIFHTVHESAPRAPESKAPEGKPAAGPVYALAPAQHYQQHDLVKYQAEPAAPQFEKSQVYPSRQAMLLNLAPYLKLQQKPQQLYTSVNAIQYRYKPKPSPKYQEFKSPIRVSELPKEKEERVVYMYQVPKQHNYYTHRQV